MAIKTAQTLADTASRPVMADKSYAQKNRERFNKIKSEPLVAVYGNPLYIKFLGDVYSFDYQDFPVTIQFDGKQHYFHKTIAELLQSKLDAAAMANVAQDVGDGDKL